MKLFLLLTVLIGIVPASRALVPVASGCAPSAEAAVSRLLSHSEVSTQDTEGFRVVTLRRDPVRNTAWAMVVSCADPARPMQAFEVDVNTAGPSTQAVRIGDRVAVREQGSNSRFELTGVARDTGALHEIVRVQMPRLDPEDTEQPPTIIRCRVIAPGRVEPALSTNAAMETR